MKLETMQALVKRAHEALPAAAAREILLAAALMAEAAEGAVEAKPAATAGAGKSRTRTLDGLLVTKRTLRERGLEYGSVAECAHELVEVKKMSRTEAAKRMGCDTGRVSAALINYRIRFGGKTANGAARAQ